VGGLVDVVYKFGDELCGAVEYFSARAIHGGVGAGAEYVVHISGGVAA
jgi:hypothetical protein